MKNKIAISVNNEREFNALMKHYDSKGFKWGGTGDLPTEPTAMCERRFNDPIEYCEHFYWPNKSETQDCHIIPFPIFAEIAGFNYKEEIVIELHCGVATVSADGIQFTHEPLTDLAVTAYELTQIITAFNSLKSAE